MRRVFPRIVADCTKAYRLSTSPTYPSPVYQSPAGFLPRELVLAMARWPGPLAWYESRCFPVMPLFESLPGLSFDEGIASNVAMKAAIDSLSPPPDSSRAEHGRTVYRWFNARVRRLVADWRLSQYAPEHGWAFLYGRLVQRFGSDAMTCSPRVASQRAYYHAATIFPDGETLQQRWEKLVAATDSCLPALAVVG